MNTDVASPPMTISGLMSNRGGTRRRRALTPDRGGRANATVTPGANQPAAVGGAPHGWPSRRDTDHCARLCSPSRHFKRSAAGERPVHLTPAPALERGRPAGGRVLLERAPGRSEERCSSCRGGALETAGSAARVAREADVREWLRVIVC